MKSCVGCNWCGDHKFCNNFKGDLRKYDGLRFTADGFDCALPVSFDTYSTCSFNCLYCFSNFLVRDPHKKGVYRVGAERLKVIDNFLTLDNAKTTKEYAVMQNVLRGKDGKKCPIQWGALGDPFDNIERWQGLGLELAKLFVKHQQPCRISTKGGLVLQQKEYLDALSFPEIFWVSFSIISTDDELLKYVDIGAPSSADRFKAMKELSRRGVKTSVRFRPITPNISDRTSKKRKIWKDLIDKAADAGAKAISMEFLFVPQNQPPNIKNRMKQLENITNIPLTEFYKKTTDARGTCLRGSRWWKEDLVFACKEHAHKNGLVFSVSDPHWKEEGDTGCCCGILPDDPVFGGWQRESATNRLIEARRDFEAGGEGRILFGDIDPPWAKDVSLVGMVCITKAAGHMAKKHLTWESKLQEQWNDFKYYRNPVYYFGGVLKPLGVDKNRNRIYGYNPVERRHLKTSWDT